MLTCMDIIIKLNTCKRHGKSFEMRMRTARIFSTSPQSTLLNEDTVQVYRTVQVQNMFFFNAYFLYRCGWNWNQYCITGNVIINMSSWFLTTINLQVTSPNIPGLAGLSLIIYLILFLIIDAVFSSHVIL